MRLPAATGPKGFSCSGCPDDGGDFSAQSDVLANMLTSDYLTEKIYLSERTIIEARQRVIMESRMGYCF